MARSRPLPRPRKDEDDHHRRDPGRRAGHTHEIEPAQGDAPPGRPADDPPPADDLRGGVRPHRRRHRPWHGRPRPCGGAARDGRSARTRRHRPRRAAGRPAVRRRRCRRAVRRQPADRGGDLARTACPPRAGRRAGRAAGDAPDRSWPVWPRHRSRRVGGACRRMGRRDGRRTGGDAVQRRRDLRGRRRPRALADAEGLVAAIEAPEDDARGINSRAELAAAEAAVQARLRAAALEAGVTMTDPATVWLCADTRLAPDVTIGPNVVFGPGVVVETGAEIRAFSHLEGCTVGRGAVVGPFARLRPGTVLGAGAHVGNFVEAKAAVLGEGAKVNHLTYLGDAEVGARTNIGAGTITCNYDGFAKHRTVIGADVFIGSDSVLVAPVTIGDGALVTAGSVITDNVEPDAMAFGRARQDNRPGRAAAFRNARRKEKA